MHLLWTFMGASDAYSRFTGFGELLGGVLLCARCTTLLGALVSFAVMSHVVALNFCYDVPVKLFSSHLVLTCLFLIAPDFRWMVKAFVFGQPTQARGSKPLFGRPLWDRSLSVARTVVVLTFISATFYNNYDNSKLYGKRVPEPPLFGLWEVEEFILDGTSRPPSTTDEGRWQRVIFRKPRTFQKSKPGKPSVGIINMLGKQLIEFEVEVNQNEKTIRFQRLTPAAAEGESPGAYSLSYNEPESNVINLEGELDFSVEANGGLKTVNVRLRHYGKDRFLLLNRGFRWINEVPYNRFGPRTADPPKIPPAPKRK
jgi:hypothetical protein